MDKEQFSVTLPDFEAHWQSLNASNDFIFSKMMQNPVICQGLIETLLDIEIDHIEYPETQKSIDITESAKSVRLDVYVNDEAGTSYNIEMQTTSQKYLAKRARYYQGIIDLNTISKGQLYDKLKESFVIFICTFDPFEQNRAVYRFENCSVDDPELKLKDGTYKYFFNTKSTDNINETLKQTLDFFENILPSEPTDLIRRMTEEVQRIKSNTEWRIEYMTLLMREQEKYQMGMEKGRAEGESIGLAKGRVEGESIGLAKGRVERDNEILKNMKALGLTQELIDQILMGNQPPKGNPS